MERPGWIVVGPIGGCPEQLEQALDWAAAQGPRSWVFLGGYGGSGPDPDAVVRLLQGVEAKFLVGPSEIALTQAWLKGHQPALARWRLDAARLSAESFDWLRGLTDDRLEVEGWRLWSHPWAGPAPAGMRVVHAGPAGPRPRWVDGCLGLDSGCGDGGPLSAVLLPEGRLWQSSPSAGRPTADLDPGPPVVPFDEDLEEL